MKKMFIISLALISLLSACKKDDPVVAPTATLQTKWTLENTVIKEYINGVLTYTTTMAGNGTFIDFQTNGNLIVTPTSGPSSSSPYILLPGSKVQFGKHL